MTMIFSQLMIELKKNEIEIEILSNNGNANLTDYITISENCISSLKELNQSTHNLDNKNPKEIKDHLNRILQIYKKELEPTCKIINNKLKQIDNNLSKIVKKVDSINEKSTKSSSNKSKQSKILLTSTEHQTIINFIEKISNVLEEYKNKFVPVNKNLNIIQEQIANVKDYIRFLEYSEDTIKLIKSIDYFIEKISAPSTFIDNKHENNELLLNKLIYLTIILKDLNVNPEQPKGEKAKDFITNPTEQNEENIDPKEPQLLLTQFIRQNATDDEKHFLTTETSGKDSILKENSENINLDLSSQEIVNQRINLSIS